MPSINSHSTIMRLKLDCNYLSHLPGTIFLKLSDLRFLSASGNRLAELPEEICNSRLEELNVRNNLIEKLPI